jgi:hypothetical protein
MYGHDGELAAARVHVDCDSGMDPRRRWHPYGKAASVPTFFLLHFRQVMSMAATSSVSANTCALVRMYERYRI